MEVGRETPASSVADARSAAVVRASLSVHTHGPAVGSHSFELFLLYLFLVLSLFPESGAEGPDLVVRGSRFLHPRGLGF